MASERNRSTVTLIRSADPSTPASAHSNDDGRRGDGSTGAGIGADSNPAGSGTQAQPAPAPDQRTANAAVAQPAAVTAKLVMSAIGTNFLTNRKRGRSTAFKQLEADIMGNFAILVPDSLSFDKLVSTIMDIEKFLKDNPDSSADKNPSQLFMEFLQGSASDDSVEHIV